MSVLDESDMIRAERRRGWQGTAAAALITVLLVLGVGAALRRYPDSPLTIAVDLTVPQTGTIEVFANVDKSRPQHRATTVAAGRATITFDDFHGPLSTLRVDPIDLPQQRVQIHQITVVNDSGDLLFSIDGNGLSSWGVYNGTASAIGAEGFAFTTTTNDASIAGPAVVLSSGGRPAAIETMVRWFSRPWSALVLITGLPAVIIGAGLLARRRWALVPPLTAIVVTVAVASAMGAPIGRTAAETALGQAAYLGRDAFYGQRFLTTTTVAVVGSTIGLLALRRQLPFRRRRIEPSTLASDDDVAPVAGDDLSMPSPASLASSPPSIPPGSPLQRAALVARRVTASPWFSILLVPICFAVMSLPSVRALTTSLTDPLRSTDWDGANLVTWHHFFAVGLQPMNDFWYPYGNLIFLNSGVGGALLDWSLRVLAVLAFSLALWNTTGRRLLVVTGTAGVAMIGLQFFTGGARYLLPFAVVAWFASSRRRSGRQRIAAVVAVAVMPWVAVDLGLYAVAGTGIAMFLDEVHSRGAGAFRRRVLTDIGIIAAGWLSFVLFLTFTGRVGPTLRYVFDQEATTSYVASVSDMDDYVGTMPWVILIIGPFVMISSALYGAVRSRGRTADEGWIPVVGGLGVFMAMVLAKQLIRPGLDGVLALAAVAIVPLALGAAWKAIGPRLASIATAGFVAALMTQVIAGHWLATWRSDVTDAPGEAIELVKGLTVDRGETPWLHSRLREAQFVQLEDELAVRSRLNELGLADDVFVLGDSQFLYPMLGQDPFWLINLYDMSPIAQQEKVLDELTERPPRAIVHDRRDASFDAVPNILRVPLLYSWIVDRYSFVEAVGPYDILVPTADAAVDWPHWRDVLGAEVGLGRLPVAATSDRAPCRADDEACVSYLRIEPHDVEVATVRTIDISGPRGEYRVSLVQEPGDDTLAVPLSRLWFWTDDSRAIPSDPSWIDKATLVEVEDGEFLY